MEATITAPKQRDLQNISVNYLVESCINEAKAKKVMEMMQEALDEDAEPFDDLYSNSDLNENMFREMILNSNLSFFTRLTEAYSRNPQVSKKIIREHYTQVIRDDSMRKQLWVLEARLRLTKKQYHREYYQKLVKSVCFGSVGQDVIEKDINRTKGTPEELQVMKNVLTAYSRRNSRVGYVQGQNFIVRAILDLMQTEEDTFWVYCFVIEECFSVGYFINLKTLMLDSYIFRVLLKAVDPKLVVKLESLRDFHLDIVTFQWFLSLYYDTSLAKPLKDAIWDLLILGDRLVYVKAAFVILNALSAAIIKCQEISDIYQLFSKMHDHVKLSPQEFIDQVSKVYVNERILNILRVSNQHKINVADQKAAVKSKSRRPSTKRNNSPGCSGRTIICKEASAQEEPVVSADYFTMCVGDITKNRIFDYFSPQNSFWQENKRRKKSELKEEDMVAHRQPHRCIKGSMRQNYDRYEEIFTQLDLGESDARKEMLATFHSILQQSKSLFGEKREDDSEEEEIDTKTVRKGSNRYYRHVLGEE